MKLIMLSDFISIKNKIISYNTYIYYKIGDENNNLTLPQKKIHLGKKKKLVILSIINSNKI